jgi:hypothetical protein
MPQHYLNHQRLTKVLLALLLVGLASCASDRSATPTDVAASTAAAGTAAAAAEAAQPAATEATVPAERECRSVATVSGSKMRRSVCHTPAEWAVIDQRELNRRQSQEDFFRRAIENSTFSSGGSTGSPAGRP